MYPGLSLRVDLAAGKVHAVEYQEERQSHKAIERPVNKNLLGIKGNDLAEQRAPHHPVEELMKEEEKEAENQADEGILDIEPHTH